MLLAVRLAWGWYASKTVDEAVEALRNLSSTAKPAALASVSDDQNAWLVLRQLALEIKQVSPFSNLSYGYENAPPFSRKWSDSLVQSEGENAALFALLRKSRSFKTTPFDVDILHDPILNQVRSVAGTMADAAMYSASQGDYTEAIERCLDLHYIADTLRHGNHHTAHLVAIGIDALADERMMAISGMLPIPSTMRTRPSWEQPMRQMIAGLLDDEASWKQLTLGLQNECVQAPKMMEARAKNTWLVRPAADLDLARYLRDVGTVVESSKQRTKTTVEQILATKGLNYPSQRTTSAFVGNPPRYSRYFRGEYDLFNLTRVIETHFRAIGDQRSVATVLAIRLYQLDHAGRLPQRLDQLVPGYLSAVPTDPFTGDPLQYSILPRAMPDGSDRAVVIFTPIGSSDYGPPKKAAQGWLTELDYAIPRTNGEVRQYRDILPFPAVTTSPSTQAIDHHPAESEDPGN